MNNRDRKNNKTGSSLGILVIVAVLLLESVFSAAAGADVFGLIAVVVLLGIIGFAVAYSLARKKGGEKKPSIKSAQQAKERAKQYFMRDELEEEAVKCAHLRGKEKYIQQLDNFLASGLIDKAEYRVLKARYDKLNITDNMH